MWIIVCIPNLFLASVLHTHTSSEPLHRTAKKGQSNTKCSQTSHDSFSHPQKCLLDKNKPRFRVRCECIHYVKCDRRHDRKSQVLTVDRDTRTLRNLEEVSETMSFSRVVPYSAKRPKDISQESTTVPFRQLVELRKASQLWQLLEKQPLTCRGVCKA